MIELPEAYVLSDQINQTLVGRTIVNAEANTHPHAFAWYTGDPADYRAKLAGKKIRGTNPQGHSCNNVKIICEDMLLVISTPIRYHETDAKLPKSHQLLLEFEDKSHMSCTVQMWGVMFCYPADESCRHDGFVCSKKPSPYMDIFDEGYFDDLWQSVKPGLSVKEFLTTKQRISGLGNGVLQDILWNAGIHPRRKLSTFTETEREKLFQSLKQTLFAMRNQGGRNTERDLFGQPGGYRTILSSKTMKNPCPVCNSAIIRESYLGGNIYYCPVCQPVIT